MNGRVIVDLRYLLEQLRLGDILGEFDKIADDVCLDRMSQPFVFVVKHRY